MPTQLPLGSTELLQSLAIAYRDHSNPGCIATTTRISCSTNEKLRARYTPVKKVTHNVVDSTIVCCPKVAHSVDSHIQQQNNPSKPTGPNTDDRGTRRYPSRNNAGIWTAIKVNSCADAAPSGATNELANQMLSTGPCVRANSSTTTYPYSHHRKSVWIRLLSICIAYKSTQAPLATERLKLCSK